MSISVENEIIGLLKELSYEPKVQLDHIGKYYWNTSI